MYEAMIIQIIWNKNALYVWDFMLILKKFSIDTRMV